MKIGFIIPNFGPALCKAGLTVFLVFGLCMGSFAKETVDPMTVGIIPLDSEEFVLKATDSLHAAFGGENTVLLVERERLGDILQELNLSEALGSPTRRLQLGEILGADFLVLLESMGEDELHLRVVDCVTGCIVYTADLPVVEEDFSKLLQQTARSMVQQMNWMADTPRDRMIPVSLAPLDKLSPDATADRQTAETVWHRLRAGLVRNPELVFLEREELDRARREMEQFRGEAAEFWNAAVIITGTIGLQGAELRELFADLTIHFSEGIEQSLEPLVRESNEIAALTEELFDRVVDRLTADQKILDNAGFDIDEEVEFLSLLAEYYHLREQYDKARVILDSIFALQKDEPTKEQRIKMAQILQELPPRRLISDHPPEKLDAYNDMVELYIYIMENYLQPWRYQYGPSGNVAYARPVTTMGLRRFFKEFPPEISKIIEEQRKNPDKEVPEYFSDTMIRLNYLRELFRQYVINSGNIRTNILYMWDDPEKIKDWYRYYLDTLLEEFFKAIEGEKLENEEPSFMSLTRIAIIKNLNFDPDVTGHYERFKQIRAMMRMIPVCGRGFCPESVIFDKDELLRNLEKISHQAFEELCTALEIDKWSKALLFVSYDDLLASARHRADLIDLFRRYIDTGQSHWILEKILVKSNSQGSYPGISRRIAIKIWHFVHSLSVEEQRYLLKNWFFPKMKEHPASPLADPQISLGKTRGELK